MTREQYEAALSQETQTFSLPDADGGNGYPVQNGSEPGRRHGDERSYGRDAGGYPYPYSKQPGNPAPAYGGSYEDDSYDHGTRSEPRRTPPSREAAGRDGYTRPGRPVYPDRRGPYDTRGR